MVEIRAIKGVFNKQIYFNAIVDTSLLCQMTELPLSPEDCNMIFIEDDNFIWNKEKSILSIKDITKARYLLFTGDLDIVNENESLPFIICNEKQDNTLFYN